MLRNTKKLALDKIIIKCINAVDAKKILNYYIILLLTIWEVRKLVVSINEFTLTNTNVVVGRTRVVIYRVKMFTSSIVVLTV